MMYRTLVAAVAACALAGGLAACAQPEPGSPAAAAAAERQKEEARIGAVKSTVDETPSWFLNPPREDLAIYAPGTATSSDMQLALDKAVLSAKRTLADTLNSLLSSKMKQFVSESGAGEDAVVLSETERVTTNLITETTLAGYQRTQAKVIPQGSQYRAYVLLQYPTGSANKVLMDRVKQERGLESKLRSSKAFQELEQEIQAARGR